MKYNEMSLDQFATLIGMRINNPLNPETQYFRDTVSEYELVIDDSEWVKDWYFTVSYTIKCDQYLDQPYTFVFSRFYAEEIRYLIGLGITFEDGQ